MHVVQWGEAAGSYCALWQASRSTMWWIVDVMNPPRWQWYSQHSYSSCSLHDVLLLSLHNMWFWMCFPVYGVRIPVFHLLLWLITLTYDVNYDNDCWISLIKMSLHTLVCVFMTLSFTTGYGRTLTTYSPVITFFYCSYEKLFLHQLLLKLIGIKAEKKSTESSVPFMSHSYKSLTLESLIFFKEKDKHLLTENFTLSATT